MPKTSKDKHFIFRCLRLKKCISLLLIRIVFVVTIIFVFGSSIKKAFRIKLIEHDAENVASNFLKFMHALMQLFSLGFAGRRHNDGAITQR